MPNLGVLGGETCEVWNSLNMLEIKLNLQGDEKGSDRIWRLLSKPMEGTQVGYRDDIIEWRTH